MRRPQPARDAIVIAWLNGAAKRHAGWTPPQGDQRKAAIAELQDLAGDRPDLLGQVAGLLRGTAPASHPQQHQIAAELLVEAGADPAVVEQWVPVGAERVRRAGPPLNDMRVTAEQAKSFIWPPVGTRRRGDRPPCLTCGCPADRIRHDENHRDDRDAAVRASGPDPRVIHRAARAYPSPPAGSYGRGMDTVLAYIEAFPLSSKPRAG